MKYSKATSVKSLFLSRLDTLEHLIERGEEHFDETSEMILERQIASDMLPFGTQIVFTCNQPHNFSRWCKGMGMDNIDPNVQTLSQARSIISDVKSSLRAANAEDAKFDEITLLELGDDMYAELSGTEYIEDFLIPNFYFHLVTAYNILRMSGVQIGKRDYMLHLLPKVKQRDT